MIDVKSVSVPASCCVGRACSVKRTIGRDILFIGRQYLCDMRRESSFRFVTEKMGVRSVCTCGACVC